MRQHVTSCGSTAIAGGHRFSMHATGIGTLILTVVLCLPSLIGGVALLTNVVLYRDIGQWEQTSSALVALGFFVGGPLVALAAVVGGIIAFSRNMPLKLKYAHLFVVSLATITTLLLLLRFGSVSVAP